MSYRVKEATAFQINHLIQFLLSNRVFHGQTLLIQAQGLSTTACQLWQSTTTPETLNTTPSSRLQNLVVISMLI